MVTLCGQIRGVYCTLIYSFLRVLRPENLKRRKRRKWGRDNINIYIFKVREVGVLFIGY